MIVIIRKNLRTLILLSSITLITANKPHQPKPRSVNVALETSFLFDPKDLQQNRYFVSNIREFMDKVLRVLPDPQKLSKDFRAQSKRSDSKQQIDEGTNSVEKIENKIWAGASFRSVLDFVRTVGQTFVKLSGNKIAEAVNNIHVEVVTETTKSKNKGHITAIPETFQTRKPKHVKKHFKEVISDSINDWMRRYPKDVKTIMNNTVDTINPLLNTLARRMNHYYNEEDIKQLKELLKKFKRHIENNQDTSEIVNELLNNAVFKKYGSLNETTKSALMEDLKMCTEFLLSKDVFKVNEQEAVMTRRSLPTKETGEIRDLDDMTYTNLRRSIDNKLKDTRGEKNMIKRRKTLITMK